MFWVSISATPALLPRHCLFLTDNYPWQRSFFLRGVPHFLVLFHMSRDFLMSLTNTRTACLITGFWLEWNKKRWEVMIQPRIQSSFLFHTLSQEWALPVLFIKGTKSALYPRSAENAHTYISIQSSLFSYAVKSYQRVPPGHSLGWMVGKLKSSLYAPLQVGGMQSNTGDMIPFPWWSGLQPIFWISDLLVGISSSDWN